MNCRLFVFVALWSVCCTSSLASPFQNLDFEQRTFHSPPTNYVPNGNAIGPNPISDAFGLPFWTAKEDATVCTALRGGGGALDETSVALFGPTNHPIDGSYTLELSAYANAPSDLYKTSSISQTGDVPANAKSIQFLLRSPYSIVQSNPLVTLNGTTINLVPISTNGNIVTMAGDVSAFAGTTAQLQISAAGTSGNGFFYTENYFDLDDISFSPNPAPEPSSIALCALGGLIAFAAKRLARC
jgi:hypothetical protein